MTRILAVLFAAGLMVAVCGCPKEQPADDKAESEAAGPESNKQEAPKSDTPAPKTPDPDAPDPDVPEPDVPEPETPEPDVPVPGTLAPEAVDPSAATARPTRSGDPKTVAFAVAWCTDEDSATAAKTAATDAIEAAPAAADEQQ